MVLSAEVNGDWLCQVKGVRVPQPDLPYVLDRTHIAAPPIAGANAAPQPTLPPAPVLLPESPAAVVIPPSGTYLPVFLVLDASAQAAPLAANIAAGVEHLVTRLRGRPPGGAAPYSRDQALHLVECLYPLVDSALSALASGVKRVQAATPPDFVRTLA